MLMEIPDDVRAAVRDLVKELDRQNQKWGSNRNQAALLWLAILTEETGEVARALLERDPVNLRNELVQVAAVAIAWIEAIDREPGNGIRST